MSVEEPKDALKGTTLRVYRFLLKSRKPVGPRELQRALKLSSPSVAMYHLTRLEDVGLLRREDRGFAVAKYLLENTVKISRFLIPRYFFYAVFAVVAFLLELTVMKPEFVGREYIFCIAVTMTLASFLICETAQTWLKGNL